jgi:hypothetical protein
MQCAIVHFAGQRASRVNHNFPFALAVNKHDIAYVCCIRRRIISALNLIAQSREHQISHWPSHKVLCKRQRLRSQLMELAPVSPGLPPLARRLCWLEDFVKIHAFHISQAVDAAIHLSDHPFDFSKQYAFFKLSYRTDNNGNPSKMFRIRSVSFENEATSEPDMKIKIALDSNRLALEADMHHLQFHEGFLGVLFCVCPSSSVSPAYRTRY